MVMILAVVGMVMGVMAPASAGGNTSAQLEEAGYTCFNAGPDNWTHCIKDFSKKSISVKVFSEDGETFFGTEALLHLSRYSGQPCPQDNLETWDFGAGPGGEYFACHHFNTGRN